MESHAFIRWLTLLLYLLQSVSCLSNDILGLDIPGSEEPSSLDANTVCKTYPGLTLHQYTLCAKHPDVAASAIQGVQIAIHECQYQFRLHRWNCSALETKNKNPHASPLLAKGYRETGFAYAIMAAGMLMQVARACVMGKLVSCGCAPPRLDESTRQWSWEGCHNNIDFANAFTRKFLDAKEFRSKDIHSQISTHNNKVGRNMVRDNLKTECKCHGVSGSCELKTCWKSPPPIRSVGDWLKVKYAKATKVDNTNSAVGKLRPLRPRRRRRVRNHEIVYYENSPNFCEPSAEHDSLGTRGRVCNKTSEGMDGCEALCCGRGYNTMRVTRTERCHCRFHWCCYVVCQRCKYDQWVTLCK